MIRNTSLIGVFVHYRQAELGGLPMEDDGRARTSGMEPANAVGGRRGAARDASVPRAGEDRHFALQIGVIEGRAALMFHLYAHLE